MVKKVDSEKGKIAWSAKQFGIQVGSSTRQIHRLNAAGKIPSPIRIGGSVRWLADEITAWLKAGAPDRKTWEITKGDAA